MEKELKPCPLCGRNVRWVSGVIECRCGLTFRITGCTKEYVDNKWNMRCDSTTQSGIWLRDNLTGWKCSNCGEHIVLDIKKYGKFCPNCGKSMIGASNK